MLLKYCAQTGQTLSTHISKAAATTDYKAALQPTELRACGIDSSRSRLIVARPGNSRLFNLLYVVRRRLAREVPGFASARADFATSSLSVSSLAPALKTAAGEKAEVIL